MSNKNPMSAPEPWTLVAEGYVTDTQPVFEQYCRKALALVGYKGSGKVLDVACGPGTLSLLIHRDAGEIHGIDFSPGMLECFNREVARRGIANIKTWRMDGQHLEFGDGEFDWAFSIFGLMFFPDRGKGYREALRVLRPGGALLFNVWDRLEANEFALAVTDALAALFATDPPRFLARTPHGYHEAERIGAELRTAGFREVRVETLPRTSRAANARDVALGYCQGTPLAGEIEARAPGALARVTEQVTAALAQRHGAGVIEGAIQAHRFIALR